MGFDIATRCDKTPDYMSKAYEAFIQSKALSDKPTGMLDVPELNPGLFPFQSDLVRWALRRGRAAIFAGTGLGKTFMQSEWAHRVHEFTGGMILILAPLAVAAQTVDEASKFGIEIKLVSQQSECSGPGIYITNYQKIHHFDTDEFIGVVLDESSCLKDETAKTRTLLINLFRSTPWKLCCTATPAPNDYMELGNHSEFLGVMTQTEMLSMFFVHDGGETQSWRLKGHAEKAFWAWMSSWSACINKPSDLGYDDGDFQLPELRYETIIVKNDGKAPEGELFALNAQSLEDQRRARKTSLDARCKAASEVVNSTDDAFLIWCDLNDESELLAKSINGAIEVTGSDSDDHKEQSMLGFAKGDVRRLVSKPSICGSGMNFQACSRSIFVGVTHSFERFFQAVRRIWRFGQKKECVVYIVISDQETAVLDNLKRKEIEAARMAENMVEHMRELSRKEIQQCGRITLDYNPKKPIKIPAWLKENGHLIEA
jgi:superfamily II DNA or RNA helicase